jgi:hypothetical protein
MSLLSEIKDGEGTNKKAGVQQTNIFGNGLKVYTFKGVTREYGGSFLVNDTYGDNMAQDGTPLGVPDPIHDGIDSVLWTASAISGTWTFNSTAQAFAGTRSIDATATTDGDIAEFDKGSTVTAANYVSLTGYIYITAWPTAGTKEVLIYCWDTAGGTQVGSSVDIGNFVSTTTLNSWQQFTIPLSSLSGTANFDAVRVQTVDVGPQAAPDYYLDNLQLEQSGGGGILEYSTGPEGDDIWKINSITISMADAFIGTVADGTLPNIPYNGFFNLSTLSNGINIQSKELDTIKFNFIIKDFIDLMALPVEKIFNYGGDGTNSWYSLTLKFNTPFLLYGETNDVIKIIISDDLSGLEHFKTSLSYGIKINEI